MRSTKKRDFGQRSNNPPYPADYSDISSILFLTLESAN